MIGIVWVRHHGDLSPVLVKGDRLAVLMRAAKIEGWSDDWVDAVEYTADDGSWVVLKGETGDPADLFDAIEEGRAAWQAEVLAARRARLAGFVPEPTATVWLLPPGVAGEAARPADWEVLETFVGAEANAKARELATQLGLPVFRVRIEAGETKP